MASGQRKQPDNPSRDGAHDEENRPWHLGTTPQELAFAEFQHAMMCLSEAFFRFAGRSLAQIAGDQNMSGQDSVILQVIHSGNRPKSITDLQHFTNRTDVSNIQYSVRKLQKAGLVRRARAEGRGAAYELTERGLDVVDAYVKSRRELLADFPEVDDRLIGRLEDARRLAVTMTGLYDQASRYLIVRQ